MKVFVGLICVGVAVLLSTAGAVPPPGFHAVYSNTLSPSVTPCRSWIFPCLGGVYQCTNQSVYANFHYGPQLGCPALQNSTATPPPGANCSLGNNTCSFVEDVPTCVSWRFQCDYHYNCVTQQVFENFLGGVDELEDCFPEVNPPSPNAVCVPRDGGCGWHDPCRTWQGWCNGPYQCGTEEEQQAFFHGPQPSCVAPLPNATQPVPAGECVHQDGQCVWSECVSWRSTCHTSWECGSNYEYQVFQALPPTVCPAPPPYFIAPPEPGVCQISGSGMCEFQGEPECTGGREYTTCGTLCPRTCENHQLDFACLFECVSGCFCPPDTVLHDDQCIPSWQCPGENSCYLIDCAPGYECLVYEETGEGYCSPSCEELNPCARNEQCVLTTVTCIRSPCPPQLSCEAVCTEEKEWQRCGTACPLSCSNYTLYVACTEQCVQGCFCPEGTYIHGDRCVPITECAGYTTLCALILCPAGHTCVDNGPNDAYCEPSCDPAHGLCAERERCELVEQDCEGRPSCPHTYRCREKCTGGKEWSECGTACPDTCETYGTPVACTLQCVAGCFCPSGKVDLNGVCIYPSMCSNCQSCKEGEVCTAVSEENGAEYVLCKGPTATMCNFSDALPASSCAPGYRCITHNTTGSSHCLQSCYLQNGGCSDDEVCYYERKDGECNQLLEPCFKTTCTDDPEEVGEEDCPIGWESSECASACQPTCEDYLNPQIRPCIALCAKCQCPYGMVVFRERCVDPLECHILLSDSVSLNPLPQPGNVVLVKFTLDDGVSLETLDSPGFATSARNVLLRHGLDLQVEVYAVLVEDGRTVIVLKVTADPDQLRFAANVLMENGDGLSSGVSSAAIVDTRGSDDDDDDDGDDDDDDDDGDGVSVAVIVGSIVAVVVVCSLLIIAFVISVTLIFKRRNLKMNHVRIPFDEKEKRADGVSFASLVSNSTENDYEIS